jgi:hypothetical protein
VHIDAHMHVCICCVCIPTGDSVLINAVNHGSVDSATLLLEYKADVNAVAKDRCVCVCVCVCVYKFECV